MAALHQPPALLGWHAARLLAERDATIIAVSDSRGATWNPRGLDIAALHAHKMSSGSMAGFPRAWLLAFAGRACVCPARPVVTGILDLKELPGRFQP